LGEVWGQTLSISEERDLAVLVAEPSSSSFPLVLPCQGYSHPCRVVCPPWGWAAPAKACKLALGGLGRGEEAHAIAPFLACLSSLWEALGGSLSLGAG